MNPTLVLLKRNFFSIRRDMFSNVLLYILFPLMIHMFILIPLSKIIILDIKFFIWSSSGLLFVCSGYLSFYESMHRFQKIRFETKQLDVYMRSPISNMHILLFNILTGIILGTSQLLIGILFLIWLNNIIFNIFTIILLISQVLPVIILMSTLGTMMGSIVQKNATSILINILIFLFMTFGVGGFIPLSHFPAMYIEIISIIPLTGILQNIQKIIHNDAISILNIFLTLFVSVALYLFNLVYSYKYFKK
tara:strand:- start:1592 stop:2338 length:747 start_codon:yes stop_codon:yes gene_type:complete